MPPLIGKKDLQLPDVGPDPELPVHLVVGVQEGRLHLFTSEGDSFSERTVVAAQISHLICIKNTSCEIWVSQHSLPITCVLISVQAPRINPS